MTDARHATIDMGYEPISVEADSVLVLLQFQFVVDSYSADYAADLMTECNFQLYSRATGAAYM